MARGKVGLSLDLPRPAALQGGADHGTKQAAAYAALRDAILQQLLPAGARLPSTRTLAARWGLSRGTLELVFDRLQAEAYVARNPGSGTRVSAVIPERYLMARYDADAAVAAPARAGAAPAPGPVEAVVQMGVPFVARLADPALFSVKTWSKCVARALRLAPLEVLCAPDPSGAPALRGQIADYLRKYRGISCTADDVVVTTGIRHALDLVARSALRAGDKVGVEDPGYPAARRIFAMAGAVVAPIPVGPDGLESAPLQAHADMRLLYVSPAHQSPTGVTMSLTRRLELLAWSNRRDAWIVEDDYDSEFNYHSAPPPALKSLDQSQRVIYCGSFNKTLFVGLRVGFMVVPQQLKRQLLSVWQSTGRSVGVTEQLALANYLEEGAFVRHLRTARRAYQERRDVVLACLAEGAPGRHRASGHQAGLHFVLWLPDGCDEAAFCARAAAVGLMLQPMATFCVEIRLPPAVIVGYTALTNAQARFGAQKLAQLLLEK